MAMSGVERARRHRERYPERGAENMRRYRGRSPERAAELNRQAANKWRKAHPDKVKELRNSPKGRWQFFKGKAKSRNIPLLLTFEEWRAIAIAAECHYCGKFIDTNGGSLDRKNSAKGYEIGNVVPCCVSCNRIRNEDLITYDEMLYIMPILLAYRERR